MNEAIDLLRRHIPQHVIDIMPSRLAHKNLVIPIEEDCGTLVVAMADPDDYDTVEKLRFVLNLNIEPRLATSTAIQFALSQYYST